MTNQSINRPKGRGFQAGLAIILLITSGCSLSPWRVEQVDELVAEHRQKALSCKPTTVDRCSQNSPVMAAARQAVHDSRHHVTLLETGVDALILRIHLIRAAQRSIEMQSFILRPDDTGELLLNEMLEAARRGVRVRLLLDQMFSGSDLEFLAGLTLAHANFEIRFYNPSFNKARTDRRDWVSGVACCFKRFNQRMHNKALVVDDVVSIIGGRNVADRYFDFDPFFNFKDRDVAIYGPTSIEVRESFDLFWNGKKSIPVQHLRDVAKQLLANNIDDANSYQPPPRLQEFLAGLDNEEMITRRFIDPAFEVSRLEYFSDLPRKQAYPDHAAKKDITQELFNVLTSAQESVLIQSPYMVLSKDARQIFKKIRQENPGIELVFSTNSLASTDADSVYANTHKHKIRYVEKLNFSMYEFKPYPGDAPEFFPRWPQLILEQQADIKSRFSVAEDDSVIDIPAPRSGLHTKSFVVDGRVAMVGSHNFDPRSEGFNTENGLIVWDEAFAQRVEDLIRQDTAPRNSWVVALKPNEDSEAAELYKKYQPGQVEEPRFYGSTSAYELIPYQQPVSPKSAEFYDRYYAVGGFPQVTRTRREWMILFLGSFFGFLEPIF